MNKKELIAQKKIEEPILIKTINDQEIQLSSEEYEQAIEAWAEMRLVQIAEEQRIAQQEIAKTALLAKLGLTHDEAKLLLQQFTPNPSVNEA